MGHVYGALGRPRLAGRGTRAAVLARKPGRAQANRRLFLQNPSSNTLKQPHPATWGMSLLDLLVLKRQFNQDLGQPQEKGDHSSSQARRQLSLPGMSSGRAPEEP